MQQVQCFNVPIACSRQSHGIRLVFHSGIESLWFSVFLYFYQLLTYFNSLSRELQYKKVNINNKKISLKMCTKTGENLKIRWSNHSLDWRTRPIHSALLSGVCSSSLQCCKGKMMLFSVGSYIMIPDMTESACFWSASWVVKVCHFYWLPPCHGRLYTSWQGVYLCRSSRLCQLRSCNMSPTLDVSLLILQAVPVKML